MGILIYYAPSRQETRQDYSMVWSKHWEKMGIILSDYIRNLNQIWYTTQ